MSIRNNIVSAPIYLGEVADLLGENKNIGAVCKSSNINIWSKHKPIRNNSAVTDNGAANKYGMISTYLNNPSLLVSIYDGNMNGWSYNLVTTPPYRLGDFNGYNHNAIPPIGNVTVSGAKENDVYKVSKGNDITFSAMTSVIDDNSLSLSDMIGLDAYFGIYAVDSDGKSYCATSSSPTVTFEKDVITSEKVFTAYPIISSVSKPSVSTTIPNGKYYLIPKTLTILFRLVDATVPVQIILNASIELGRLRVSGKIYGNSTTLSNAYLYIRYADKSLSDPLVSGESMIHLVDQTATTDGTAINFRTYGSTSSIPLTTYASSLPDDLINNVKIWFVIDNRYQQSIVPMREMDLQ